MEHTRIGKTLLKNAKLYDGSGGAAFLGDVLIEDDRIVQVAPAIANAGDGETVDLQGLCLAPGFIDAHSHNDWFALRREPEKYFAPFIRQGITTFVAGNCGLAATGFSDETPHKEKIGGGNVELDYSTGPTVSAPAPSGNLALANAALQELGYSAAEVAAALKGADPAASTEELVRHALRAMVMKG